MADSEVIKFYEGKKILITGATGFVGIALVEKLLRSVPEIGTIFLIVRPKRGKSVSERLQEYIKNPIFDRLNSEKGSDVFNKLCALAGDVGEENLGLSSMDKEVVKDNVNIVFHSAATLDFEANLKTTVQINLLGTRRVIKLCQEIKNLKALLHVSSAYVNSNLKSAQEILYPAPEKADKVIDMVQTLSDEELEKITPKVLGMHVNTYTFTKALAEHEVADSISLFPSCIVRPSMIVAAWKEPVPGWTNSKNGPQGFMMGAAKGVIRRLPLDTNVVCDYIPVDIVVNGMLVGAYNAAVKRPNETPIYHLTSSTYRPFRWNMVNDQMNSILHKYPLKSAVWYPYIKFIPSLFWFRVSAFIFHILPAYILDTVTKISGGRPILVRLHTNVNKSLDMLEPFIFTEWMYENKKTLELHKSLGPKDKELFGLDIGSIDWPSFFENLIQGVRQYLNNEKPTTIPAGKWKDKILRFLNLAVQLGFVMSVWWILSMIPGLGVFKSYGAIPIVGGIFSLL